MTCPQPPPFILFRKKVAVLGATGSVGTSAIRVLRAMKEQFQVVLLSAGGNHIDELAGLAAEFHAEYAVTSDESKKELLQSKLPASCQGFAGEKALCDLLVEKKIDIVVCAIVGLAALKPAAAVLESGKQLALASKEVMVTAGPQMMKLAAEHHVVILPVDSEHSAVFQCLERHLHEEIHKIILTASGGPFRTLPAEQLPFVTFTQAMKHPTWSMGPKVTLDSATLMNKALEMIEAHHLFQVRPDQVDVVVHPQSVVHSLVEWCDGSMHALLSAPDMRFPVQYALTWPDRLPAERRQLDLAALGSLTFRRPDPVRFPCLRLAAEACAAGGCATAVLAAADELAVARFLRGEIGYTDIAKTIERALDGAPKMKCDSIEAVFAANDWVWKSL